MNILSSIQDHVPIIAGAGSIIFTIKMFLVDEVMRGAVNPDFSVIGIISTLTTAFLAALLKIQKSTEKQAENQTELLKLVKTQTANQNCLVENQNKELTVLKDISIKNEKMLETQIEMLDSQKIHLKNQNELMASYLEGYDKEKPENQKGFLAKQIEKLL